MTMHNKSELVGQGIQVDLSGPDGNAFVLLGMASNWAKQLGLDGTAILDDMRSGNYEHLLEVLEKHFGEYVDFYR